MNYGLEESAGYLIYRAGRLLRYRAAQYFRDNDIDLSPEQWMLMLQIADRGEATMGEIVEPTINDHPNVTRLVAGLAKAGYVARYRNPDDKRSFLVALTDEGGELVRAVYPGLTEAKAAFFSDLDSRDLTRLVKDLKCVLAQLEG